MTSDSDFQQVKDRVFADLGLYEQVSGLYDGQWLAGDGRRRIAVQSPINGERLADIAVGDEDDYDCMIERAWASFGEWSRVPAPKRGEVVRAIGERLRANWRAWVFWFRWKLERHQLRASVKCRR